MKSTPYRALRCAMGLTAAATCAVGMSQPIDSAIERSTPAGIPVANIVSVAEPFAYRLRCWQRGVLVVDEVLGSVKLPVSTGSIAGSRTAGQQVHVVPLGNTAICLSSSAGNRIPRGTDRAASPIDLEP